MSEMTVLLNSEICILSVHLDIHPWFDGMGFVLIPASFEILKKMQEVAEHNSKCDNKDNRKHYKALQVCFHTYACL